ncbi:rhodanese-like domain-containing protein [Thalassobellus sediminis]|uniref:rhodanese-like domain-containing protein n=1 Tax=Thalassobellus sediminis TaxID=3367753 RepID=UPI00378F2629
MKLKVYYIFVFLLIVQISSAQKTLNKLLKKYNDNSIPYISVDTLQTKIQDVIILDAREFLEYKISHIKSAIHVGYNNFNLKNITNQLNNKNIPLVVYCSLGIRSQDIAKKFKKAGYNNVENLYGGIFEWKNKNLKVYNYKEKETDSIHAFSKAWSKWLTNGIKIYD